MQKACGRILLRTHATRAPKSTTNCCHAKRTSVSTQAGWPALRARGKLSHDESQIGQEAHDDRFEDEHLERPREGPHEVPPVWDLKPLDLERSHVTRVSGFRTNSCRERIFISRRVRDVARPVKDAPAAFQARSCGG